LKKFKSMISAFETKQNEVMQAMADAQQAGISAMMGGLQASGNPEERQEGLRSLQFSSMLATA
jgi:hypothetical protein